MPLQYWSERIILVSLSDDPQFSDDMNALAEQIQQRGGADVLLDFSEVNFLNSSNIAKLLKLRKTLSSVHAGKLILCGIRTSAWGIFLVTGLDKIFTFSDDVPTGLTMLQIGGGEQKPPMRPADA